MGNKGPENVEEHDILQSVNEEDIGNILQIVYEIVDDEDKSAGTFANNLSPECLAITEVSHEDLHVMPEDIVTPPSGCIPILRWLWVTFKI